MKLRFWERFIISAGAIALVFTFPMILALKAKIADAPTSAPVTEKTQTLIIDAGHGGEDGGAVSVTGTHESTINLAIAQKSEQLSAFMGFSAVMTRESEELEYPAEATTTRARKVSDQKRRAELINSTENAVLISIHQNKYTSPSPKGAQTFYSKGGEELADKIQELFLTYINTDKNRAADKIADNIYLMRATDCPAVLVECGFISNPEEAAKLESEEYQKLLSMIIIGAYCDIYGR